jgi:hypothetical protein
LKVVGRATEANTKSKNIEANRGDCVRIPPISAIVRVSYRLKMMSEMKTIQQQQNREQSFAVQHHVIHQ